MFAYTQDNGAVATCRTKAGVPEGTSYIEVDTVPDRKYRDAWKINWSTKKVYIPVTAKRDADQAQINKDAREYLGKTDWYVMRLLDRGIAIPEDITAARLVAAESVVE